jgi:ribosomal protein S18 acetylase RimI-like enzyme
MIGVAPELRQQGIGRRLYQTIFETAQEHGRSHVHFVTAPFNSGSIAFHEKLGFELERVLEDYAGPGEDRLLFVKQLS